MPVDKDEHLFRCLIVFRPNVSRLSHTIALSTDELLFLSGLPELAASEEHIGNIGSVAANNHTAVPTTATSTPLLTAHSTGLTAATTTALIRALTSSQLVIKPA